MTKEPRHVARALFSSDSRTILLEQDVDDFERNFDSFKMEIRSEVRQIKSMAFGVMVSATTATIVGAINLVYGRL